MRHLYSEEVDPASAEFDRESSNSDTTGPKTLIDSVNQVLKQEMATNPRILVFGEDVADASRSALLGKVKGRAVSSKLPMVSKLLLGIIVSLIHP